MLDLNLIRADPAGVLAALARRDPGLGPRVQEVLALDARRRRVLPELEALRAERNRASDEIARGTTRGR